MSQSLSPSLFGEVGFHFRVQSVWNGARVYDELIKALLKLLKDLEDSLVWSILEIPKRVLISGKYFAITI